jgi:hypothetical protein
VIVDVDARTAEGAGCVGEIDVFHGAILHTPAPCGEPRPADRNPTLATTDLDDLADRARRQLNDLEPHRLATSAARAQMRLPRPRRGNGRGMFVWYKRSGRRARVRFLWWPLVLSLLVSVLLTLALNSGR